MSTPYAEEIISKLNEKWELGELLWEWNDRIVYAHAKNPCLVVKIPKDEMAFEQNKFEAYHYGQEEMMRVRMEKRVFPNGLARCALVWYCLYMQKLTVSEWSDFWVDHEGIIRRFDLNLWRI